MFISQLTFACSCFFIEDPCDNIINEYSTPVLVEVNRTIGTQIAHVTVTDVTNENPTIQQDYVIVADSLTSCGISIEHLKEGEAYYFGLPNRQIEDDTINYFQCMSPFYEFGKFSNLVFCSGTPSIKDLAIFPNPVQDRSLVIQSTLIEPKGFKIYDATGRLILKGDNRDMNDSKIDLPKSITNGLYFIRIQSGNKLIVYSSKFMVSGW